MSATYESTANELANRITALIPDNPAILTMDSPFDLHDIPGFHCQDLDPSLAQAGAALRYAVSEWKKTH